MGQYSESIIVREILFLARYSGLMKIDNKQVRQLWLAGQGLGGAPTGKLSGPEGVMAIIRALGFVQLDTIQNVTRAHHHILWSRNQNYREPMLDQLLGTHRQVFEHFTHDASVLPVEYYPYWKRQLARMDAQVRRQKWYRSGLRKADLTAIIDRIRAEGPLCTRAFDTKVKGKKEMWARPPHKKALDAMWYSGELATSHRENFTKFYDLAERVIAPEHYGTDHSDTDQIDWLCRGALERLSFGTLGDIQRFWDAVSAPEVKAWAATAAKNTTDHLMPVELQGADGSWSPAFAAPDIAARMAALSASSSRLRIINPFDPAVRDRARLMRLFGFEYRNEMFVPAKDRRWGYYVYPLLEGDRFVGRMEAKADRKKGTVTVTGLWREERVKWTDARQQKLAAELARFGRLIGADRVEWACSPIPD